VFSEAAPRAARGGFSFVEMNVNNTTRRIFIVRTLAGGCAALVAPAVVLAAAHVDEADETAVALGYKHDTRKVDAQIFPQHSAAQHCGNCAFFQGEAKDEWGGCAMFGRKHVAMSGWCKAWAKKPG